MKSKMVAAILAFLLGSFGIHKFYMGNTKAGIIYLIFCWTGIPSLLAFVEFIVYLLDTEEKFQERVEAKKFFL